MAQGSGYRLLGRTLGSRLVPLADHVRLNGEADDTLNRRIVYLLGELVGHVYGRVEFIVTLDFITGPPSRAPLPKQRQGFGVVIPRPPRANMSGAVMLHLPPTGRADRRPLNRLAECHGRRSIRCLFRPSR
jgi:hypothetical protein